MYRITITILIIGVLIIIPQYSFSISPSEVYNAVKRAEEYEQRIKIDNKYSDEMQKSAQETYKTFKKSVLPEVNKWKDKMRVEDGKIIISNSNNKKDNGYTPKTYLMPDERIYIFISSSIPEETLKSYANAIHKLKDRNITMVLRGCVGGCSKLMPTVQFVQKIIAPSEDNQLQVEVLIDPYLFRYYHIDTVPAILFAKGIDTEMDEGSEGLPENLKQKPDAYVIYGDVSLDYAIEKFHHQLSLPNLALMSEELRRGFYK